MTIKSTDFERMLREAVSKAREGAPRGVDDLVRCASSAAGAVAQVTAGAATI